MADDDFGWRAASEWLEANPLAPESIAFEAAAADLREAFEGAERCPTCGHVSWKAGPSDG